MGHLLAPSLPLSSSLHLCFSFLHLIAFFSPSTPCFYFPAPPPPRSLWRAATFLPLQVMADRWLDGEAKALRHWAE